MTPAVDDTRFPLVVQFGNVSGLGTARRWRLSPLLPTMGIFVATICCAQECSVAPECGNRLVDVQEKIWAVAGT